MEESSSATYTVKYNGQRHLYVIMSSNGRVPQELDQAWTDKPKAEAALVNWVGVQRGKSQGSKTTKQVRRRANNGG